MKSGTVKVIGPGSDARRGTVFTRRQREDPQGRSEHAAEQPDFPLLVHDSPPIFVIPAGKVRSGTVEDIGPASATRRCAVFTRRQREDPQGRSEHAAEQPDFPLLVHDSPPNKYMSCSEGPHR